ncbi:MAG: ribosome assembly RNA-binding protein YhbY [Tissierellia bacterium]|nr:ribosome assembly RNA-binding protein YhbY [Tissierellia bacterium]
MINSKQRAKLKSLAHDLKPILNIGKNSISDELLRAIDEALEKRELIKVKILNNNLDDDNYIIDEITKNLNCEFVSHIGNIITLYKRNKENSKFDI